MDRLWQYWYSLSPIDRTAFIVGIVVTVLGGLVLWILGSLGKLSIFGLRRLFGKSAPPVHPLPQPITIKLEAPQPTSPVLQQALPEIKKPTALPEIPRTPAVEFVARRDKDGHDILSQLKEKLGPGNNQLIVLWGPGGVGKTRIASEAAHSLKALFDNRIVWVSADGRPDFGISTLLDGIATQLGRVELLQLAPDPKKAQVRELIASSPPLVILDNFETIPMVEQGRCSFFLAEEASCPALITTRGIIASNVALNIPIDAMSQEEAQMFLDELIEQVPDREAFAGKTRQRIIEESGANPLVMQWVVQQMVLTQETQTILENVSQGEGDAADRVFDNSFKLPYVGDDGRAALLALSLFPLGASRASLAEVAGFGDDIGRLNVAAKSLGALRLIRTAESGKRLLVEGLTRQLAKARLLKDDPDSEFAKRYVLYFRGYVESHAEPTPEDYTALEVEKDNILSAMDAALDLEDWETVENVAAILIPPYTGMLVVHGYWDEALRRGDQALKSARKMEDEWSIAVFAGNTATVRQLRGELDEARRSHEQALAAFRKLGSDKNVAVALHQLALLAQNQGQVEEARRLYRESLEINRSLGNQGGIAAGMHQLARLAQDQGDLEEAGRLYNESLEINQSLGDRGGIASNLHQLARLAHDQHELEKARYLYNESLEIKKSLGNQVGIASALHQLAILSQDQGQLEEARRLYNESLEINKSLGNQGGIALGLHQLAVLSHFQGNLEQARRLYNQSLEIKKSLGNQRGIASGLHQLAILSQVQGDLEEARRFYSESLEINRNLGNQPGIAKTLGQLGRLAEGQDRNAEATQHFQEAVAIFEKLKSPSAEMARQDLERVKSKLS